MSLAPHEGSELSRVLDGTKPFAVIERDKDAEQFIQVLELGNQLSVQVTDANELAFCLPENSEYHTLYNLLRSNIGNVLHRTDRDYQTLMGRLFGYTDEEIEAFLNEEIKCNCTKCKRSTK